MSNTKDGFRYFNENRLNEKLVPEFNLMKFLENYKRGIDLYNSSGIKGKKAERKEEEKKVLGENNQLWGTHTDRNYPPLIFNIF